MSVYRCPECDEYQDADFHGCYEHPKDEWECICYDCLMNFNEEEIGVNK